MKKLFSLISLFALCLCSMGAEVETTMAEIYHINAWANNGQAGSTAEIFLNMKNRNAIGMWSCRLVLPEGVTYVSSALYEEEGRYPEGYNAEFTATPNANGSVSFSCNGEEGVALTGTDGTVAVVNVSISSDVEPGTYELVVTDICLVEPNNSIHQYNIDQKSSWEIEAAAVTPTATISFDLNGAPGEYAPITEEVGSEVGAPDDPEWEGHTFLGWEPAFPETMPEEDITLVAQWQVNEYNVIYIVDGEEYNRVEVAYGAEFTLIAAPEKEGYSFSGWSIDGFDVAPSTMPAQDITVTGTFEVNYYGTEFYLDEGGELYEGQEVAFGQPLIVPENPTREGYTFTGWSPEIPETMPAQDLTFIAQWQVNEYNVIYIVDGEEYARVEVAYGEAIEVVEAPVKEGYNFSGWSQVPETMPAHDVTVTGTFEVIYYGTEFYLDEGGELYESQEVAFGQPLIVPENPTREGYTFTGWNPEIPETMPAQDMTFIAQWQVNEYNVIYIVDGEEYARVEVAYGEAIEVAEAPVKDGYEFSGWSQVPETMPAEDVYVYGTFQAVAEFITITNQYTMFSSDKSLDFTDSPVKAYVAVDYVATLDYAILEEVKVVPAGTGVLLIAEAGEYKVPFCGVQDVPAVETNLFTAVLTESGDDLTVYPSTDTHYNYVLAEENVFEPLAESVNIPSKSAYLQLPVDAVAEQEAPVRFGILDTADAIKALQMNDTNEAIYDLQGRRVSNAKNGIFIIGGKKVLR